MAGKFVLTRGQAGGYRFVLLASNGKQVVSSETYLTRRSALAGVESVRRHAGGARLVDETNPTES
ncbi:MAG: hypothetical protein JWN35_3459 [Frankiales bacterium]|nr:hypothetical protein [Frankiales bacterium]